MKISQKCWKLKQSVRIFLAFVFQISIFKCGSDEGVSAWRNMDFSLYNILFFYTKCTSFLLTILVLWCDLAVNLINSPISTTFYIKMLSASLFYPELLKSYCLFLHKAWFLWVNYFLTKYKHMVRTCSLAPDIVEELCWLVFDTDNS